MFMKSEKRKKNPALIMTVGALAALGAASIIRTGRAVISSIGCKLKGVVRFPEE